MKRIFFLIGVVVFIVSCSGNTSKRQVVSRTEQANVTEVLYFHGKQRCITCNAIEKLTKEVIDSLGNEKVVMKVIDISKEENEVIAEKYQVVWSSLILDRNGKIENLTDMGFGYAKGQPDVFKTKLIEAIHDIEK